MSYEGGGGAQGPPGPTGPTGETGGISFSGPNGAVLWYDGTAITGTTGLTWTQTGGMSNAHRLFGGPNGNYLELDSGGSMSVTIDQINDGHNILLSAGATRITLTDDVTGESGLTGTLQLQISGNNGASGNVLTSDGTYATWQPPATAGISFSGPNGAVLWYDGTAITGTTGLTWTETGSYTMVGGPSGNNFIFDDNNGNMQIGLGQTDYGKQIKLLAGNTNIVLTDAVTGDEAIAGNLSVIINGSPGASGDVLTSDGTYATWQPSAGITGLTEGILDLFQGGGVTWTSDGPGYYSDFILSQPVYSNSNVQVTLINTDVNLAVNCWVINVTPDVSGDNDLRIWLAGDPNSDIYASYLIANPGITPPV
jgi:hypothetical protein